MATIDPKDNNKPSSEEARLEIIKRLDYNKQFSLKQRLDMTDKMSRDQAIDTLKDCMVHMAYKEQTYNQLLRQESVDNLPTF